MAELSELTIESKSQSADTIRKILEDQGFADIQTAEQTDRPPEPAVADAPPVAEAIPPAAEPGLPAADGEDAGETAQAAAAEPPAPAEHKKKGGFARKLEAQKSELDSLKATLVAMERKLAAPAAVQPPKPESPEVEPPNPAVAEDPEPKIEQFENEEDAYSAWVKAVARWGVRDERRVQAKREQEQKESEQAARTSETEQAARSAAEAEWKSITERWNQSLAKSKAVHPDLEEVLNRPFDPKKPTGNVVLGTVANDYDESAELCYWLGTHPDEAANIVSRTNLPENFRNLGPRAQQRAIRVAEDAAREAFDEILAKLPAAPGPGQATPAPAERRETPAAAAPAPNPAAAPAAAAPPRPKAEPPKPVGHRGGAVTKRYPEDYSTAELKALSIEDVRRLRGLS
jgi:hypothetical protein